MKNLIALTTVMVLGTGALMAQDYTSNNNDSGLTDKGIEYGVKAGVNFASVTGNDIKDPDSRTSFNAGIFAEIPLSDAFSVQPEVYYSGQGYDIKEINQANEFDTSDNIEYQLDYINVPLLAKFYIVDGLSVQAGPSFNFKVNEEIDYHPNADSGDIDLDRAKDFELGGAAGIAYKFYGGFFVEGRYNYGFTNLFENRDIHNSTFQAGLGFTF
ncbi:MAG: porin family protein [Leeuwenhoekiella sp.]